MRKIIALAFALVLLVLTSGYFLLRPPRVERFIGVPESIRIGISREPTNALIYLAQEKGFFIQSGLEAAAREYPSGKRALEGMFAGAVDVAVMADTPIVLAGFARRDFSVLATIAAADRYHKIVARKDRGIRFPNDLRGKRIATQRNSAVHYFLHLFLLSHGIADADVALSFKEPEELSKALTTGEIDAFSMREPFVSDATKRLGDRVVVFEAPALYRRTDHLVALKVFVKERPEAIKRTLQALIRAEEFTTRSPQEARRIVASRLGLTESEIAAVWPNLDLKVSLYQSMLSGFEDEARWAIGQKLTDRVEMPNYLDFLDPEGLKAVRPVAVTVIK